MSLVPIAWPMEKEMRQVCISASIYEEQVRSELNVGFYRISAVGWNTTSCDVAASARARSSVQKSKRHNWR